MKDFKPNYVNNQLGENALDTQKVEIIRLETKNNYIKKCNTYKDKQMKVKGWENIPC